MGCAYQSYRALRIQPYREFLGNSLQIRCRLHSVSCSTQLMLAVWPRSEVAGGRIPRNRSAALAASIAGSAATVMKALSVGWLCSLRTSVARTTSTGEISRSRIIAASSAAEAKARSVITAVPLRKCGVSGDCGRGAAQASLALGQVTCIGQGFWLAYDY